MTVSAPPQPEQKVAAKRWRLPKLSLVIALICLVGVGVLLYPSAAAWFSSASQTQRIGDYSHDLNAVGPVGREKALAEAHAYNATLTGGALIAANRRIPVAEAASGSAKTKASDFDYNQLLRADDYGLMARIKIPSIGVDLPIYHGTSDSVLAEGIGHLEGTALPVGGKGTHAVLAGHRGLATSTLFTNLNEVKVGDSFSIIVFGETLTYRVISTKVVDPDETKSLDPVPGKDLVTLVTCTPIGINSQRILVTGERVTPTPEKDVKDASKLPNVPGFPWWAVWLGLAVIVLALYVWLSGRPGRPLPRRHPRRPAA